LLRSGDRSLKGWPHRGRGSLFDVTELVRVLPTCTASGVDGSNAYWLLTRCSVVKEPGSLPVHTRASAQVGGLTV